MVVTAPVSNDCISKLDVSISANADATGSDLV